MSRREYGLWLASGLHPRRVLIIAAGFVVAYFGVAIVGNAINRYQLEQHAATLRAEIAALEAQQQRLEALRAYMQTDEFIERMARDEGLVMPGDTVVLVTAPAPSPTPPPSSTGPWWERYFGVGPREPTGR
jgi:cell division protein FtsB